MYFCWATLYLSFAAHISLEDELFFSCESVCFCCSRWEVLWNYWSFRFCWLFVSFLKSVDINCYYYYQCKWLWTWKRIDEKNHKQFLILIIIIIEQNSLRSIDLWAIESFIYSSSLLIHKGKLYPIRCMFRRRESVGKLIDDLVAIFIALALLRFKIPNQNFRHKLCLCVVTPQLFCWLGIPEQII